MLLPGDCKKCANFSTVYFVFILTFTLYKNHQKGYIDVASGEIIKNVQNFYQCILYLY